MAEVRFLPPAAKYLKKLKDKKLKALYQEAIDKICKDHMAGEPKTGDLSGVYGYDIYYNKTNCSNRKKKRSTFNFMYAETVG